MRARKSVPVLALPSAEPDALTPAIPQSFAQPGLSLVQLFAIVRSYLKWTTIISAVVMVATYAMVKQMPKIYAASATLLVNYEVNDPLAGYQFPIGLMASYIATQIEIMESNEVLVPVVERLKLTEDKNYTEGFNGDPATLRDYVVAELRKNLTITSGNQLMYISAQARSAEGAAALANAVADVYSEQQLRRLTGPASERAKRYAEQLADLKNKVTLAQEQVTAFRQRTGVTNVAAAGNDVESDMLNTLIQRYQEAVNLRRIAEVKQGAGGDVGGDLLKSTAAQTLKAQLVAQQTQLAQLSTTLGPRHPKVLELQSQIAATRQSIAAEEQTYAKGNTSDLQSARQLEEKLRKAVEDQRAKVLATRNVQDDGRKLELELESAQSVYKRALDGYDQIMFASEARYTNVSFVSRAQPPLKADKPNKAKLFMVGVMAGLFLGLMGPLGFEFLFNRRVRCRDDVERDLGLPVLMEFGSIAASSGVK